MPTNDTAVKIAATRRDAAGSGDDGTEPTSALRLLLKGRVQGQGVRPAIARLADELSLQGWVANGTDGVVVHLEGPVGDLTGFCARVAAALPIGAELASLTKQVVPVERHQEFRFAPTQRTGSLAAPVPADRAICAECCADVQDPLDRRRGYALTSCAHCGPRYSLIHTMPYDRDATSLRSFRQCSRCAAEFRDLDDRRFHSQINACPECGPDVWLTLAAKQDVLSGSAAIELVVQLLRNDQIVALRGVGGYQLLCDATSQFAVRRLRDRKRRESKALAVMVATLAAATQCALLDDSERAALADPTNPIVVVRRRCDAEIAADVAPGLNTIGLLLPSTALHASIASAFGRPLVVTSGNQEGDPLEFEPVTAQRALSGIADAWLHHNREIVRPIDDSVVHVVGGQRATIRLARGLAPLPLEIKSKERLLAVGGHQKSALALSNGVQSVLGQHIGDLDTETTRCRFVEQAKSLGQLYNIAPAVIAHDLHPSYFTTDWAETIPQSRIAVQHHHAHVVAGMIEPHWLDRQVLGVAWDGTGYGADGTIWGGEFLVATAEHFSRVGSLRPFFLPAAEVAVRAPWRVAVSLAYQVGGVDLAAGLRWPTLPRQSIEHTVKMLQRSTHGVWTTSAGRLFDGVASLVLGLSASGHEGEPAMLLEAIANPLESDCYQLPLIRGDCTELDWRPLIQQLLVDRIQGIAPGDMAMKFHRALAAGIGAMSDMFPDLPVVSTGGCFQNRLLAELVIERLAGSKPLALPGVIPVGDGGLAAGQLAVAAARTAGGKHSCA